MKLMPAAMASLSLAAVSFFSMADAARAGTVAEEGHHMISAAWLHVDTNAKSEPLVTTRIANGQSQTDTATSFDLDNADTLALTYTYAFDDHLSMQFLGGVPPRFTLSGKGASNLVGDLGAYGDLAKVRQWSPTLIGIYTFGNPAQSFRPYIGIGASYTKFDDIEMNPALEAAFIQAVKTRTMGLAQDVSVRAEADDAWDPVITVGGQYSFAKNWYAIGSVSYLPLSTTATVTTTINSSALPAAVPTGDFTKSQASMDIHPVVTYLGVGYRF